MELHRRLADLEERLRKIADEVRAAGLLDSVHGVPAPEMCSQLGELSNRQRQILHRILDGERVPGIAAALYLSQSTVRNHLSGIFAKFGVHSQSELISRLRSRASTMSGWRTEPTDDAGSTGERPAEHNA